MRIFVVEDDPLYRHAMEYRLKQNPHYKIYPFKTGEECFRHFELLDPDIVILDYCLNETDAHARNGLEVLKRLKNLRPDIAILMLSGKESLEVATNAIRYGAFDYIVKNEGAFVRIQNLINRILNTVNLQKWSKKRGNHLKLIGILMPLVIATPVLSHRFVPDLAPVITVSLFILVVLYFIITQRLEKAEWVTLWEKI